MPDLICIFCGGHAELHGRWANAKIICRSCGMETTIDDYRDQIEAWIDQVWKMLAWAGAHKYGKNAGKSDNRQVFATPVGKGNAENKFPKLILREVFTTCGMRGWESLLQPWKQLKKWLLDDLGKREKAAGFPSPSPCLCCKPQLNATICFLWSC